jgi:hypothetical protein
LKQSKQVRNHQHIKKGFSALEISQRVEKIKGIKKQMN